MKCLFILALSVILALSLVEADPNGPTSSDYAEYINANQVLMFVTNEGGYGRDIDGVFGQDYGTFYPYTSNADIVDGTTKWPLYSAGIWLGGQVGGETRVTVAEYTLEYTPGPMVGGTFATDAYTNDAYRAYKLYADSGASNPNTDYLEWPVNQGAPTDGYGNPLILGDQTLWSVYNDADSARHSCQAGESEPLGIEIQQTTWASGMPGYESVIYIKYKLFNRGSNSISDFYVGIWHDAEIGFREDDVAGCDTVVDIMYQYNFDEDDDTYTGVPPAFGARLLYGPIVSTGLDTDTAYWDGTFMPGYKNLEMTSCATYLNGADPVTPAESYNLMRGYMVDGTPFSSGTRYRYPGNPSAGTGDLDIWPTDKKQVASFGPIDFNPGDSQFVMIKIAADRGINRLDSWTNLMNTLVAPDSVITGIENVPAEEQLPDGYALHANYPNPFNPSTTIAYRLPIRAEVNISIFNVLGQKVRTLIHNTESAGPHTVVWDGADDTGDPQPSGIYFYRAHLGDQTASRKMLLLK